MEEVIAIVLRRDIHHSLDVVQIFGVQVEDRDPAAVQVRVVPVVLHQDVRPEDNISLRDLFGLRTAHFIY
jgi:hypothetical protein